MVHDAVTQTVTAVCNGSSVQMHVWLMGEHGESVIAVTRQEI